MYGSRAFFPFKTVSWASIRVHISFDPRFCLWKQSSRLAIETLISNKLYRVKLGVGAQFDIVRDGEGRKEFIIYKRIVKYTIDPAKQKSLHAAAKFNDVGWGLTGSLYSSNFIQHC